MPMDGSMRRCWMQQTGGPDVEVVFEVRAPTEHHHVPLLLSPYGFSTYRGS